MSRYKNTERLGVNAVSSIVTSELDWIFREQPIVDMGIDAQIESVLDGNPTGKLIAVQIKSGKGNFSESKDSFTYRGDLVHLDYWMNHSLPVILVAHFPDTNTTLWQYVCKNNTRKTQKAWSIKIPKTKVLDSKSLRHLSEIIDGPPHEQKLRRLTLDLELMKLIKSGLKVSVGFDHWYNKSLGRSEVKIYAHDKHGAETISREWFQYYVCSDPKKLMKLIFPWAIARVDVEFYNDNDEYEESDHERLMRATDIDNGFAPYVPNPNDIYPYMDSAGEVASYRVRLSLNKLGKSFLTLNSYLELD
jgi:hypothetical protein